MSEVRNRKWLRIGGFIIPIFGLLGCSIPSRVVSSSQMESELPKLAGEWISQCYALPKRHSIIFQVKFSEGKMSAQGHQFADSACEIFNLTMSLQSEYTIGNKLGEGYEIDFVPQSIDIEIYNPDALKYFKSKKVCGISNWTLHRKTELIDRSCDPTVIPPSLRNEGKDLFNIANNELRFGEFPFALSDVIPSKLSQLLPLKKVNHGVVRDLEGFEEHIAVLNSTFEQIPENPRDRSWVKSKISHMYEVDQYVREFFFKTPGDHHYIDDEKADFF